MNILFAIFAIAVPIFAILTVIKICFDDYFWDTDWIYSIRFIFVTIIFITIPLVTLASVLNIYDEAKASIAEASAETEVVAYEPTITTEPAESVETNTKDDKRLDEIEYRANKTDDTLNEITRKVEENTRSLDRIEEITEQYNSSDKKYEIKKDEKGVPQKMFNGIDKIIFGEHENE